MLHNFGPPRKTARDSAGLGSPATLSRAARTRTIMRSLQNGFVLIMAAVIALPLAVGAQSSPSPSASSASSPTPNPFVPFADPRIFIMALSGDAPTRAKLVSVLTHRLQKNYFLGATKLTAEPDWSISDYVNACQNFPSSTAGALIVQIGEISNISTSFLLISRTNMTRIHAGLLYSRCVSGATPTPVPTQALGPTDRAYPFPTPTINAGGSVTTTLQFDRRSIEKQKTVVTTVNVSVAPKPSPSPFYQFVWQSDMEDATGYRVRFWTPLTALGFLLSLASGYTALAPQRTVMSTTNKVFPTPLPFMTLPPQGATTSQSQVNTTVANPNQLGTVTTGLLASSVTYAGSVESISTADQQSLNAVNAIISSLLQDLKCPALPPAPSATGNAVAATTPAPTPTPTPPPAGACLIFAP